MSSTERGGAIEAEMVLDRWRSTAIGALRREGSTTINQYWILLMLDRPDPVPLSAVVETLELNYTTVAEGVARMAADGTVAKASRRTIGAPPWSPSPPRGARCSGGSTTRSSKWRSGPSPLFQDSCASRPWRCSTALAYD